MLRLILALLIGMAVSTPAPAMQTTVDHLKINYSVAGSGPTVIFVHGWTCDDRSWQSQVAYFRRAYRVVTLDLPGHGKSDRPRRDSFSMALFAKAVEDVRRAVGADRVVLVGHSMGAVVIRQYALTYPQHVAGLVAADGWLDVRALTPEIADQLPMTIPSRKAFIESMFVPQTSKPLRDEIMNMMLSTSAVTADRARAEMFNPAIQSNKIISAPALTIYAGRPLFPKDRAPKERIPNWQSARMPGTGHFLMMERPLAFNRILANFLATRAEL